MIKLLDNTQNETSKCRTKDQVKRNYHSRDACIVPNTAAASLATINGVKKTIFKTCASCIDCINEINNMPEDNTKDIDIVIPL